MKPTFFLAGLFAVFMIANVGSASAQGAEDALRIAERFPGTGSKQLGMAGVSRAGLADWTVVATNPAGLGWMRRSQLLGSLNSWSTADASFFSINGVGNPFDTQANHTRLGNAGYVYKPVVARGSMAFGIGYNQMNSFSRSMYFDGENGMNSITDFFMPLPGEFELILDDGLDAVPQSGDEFYTAVFSRPLSEVAFQTYAIDLDQGLIEAGSSVPFLPAVVRGTVTQSGEVLEEGGTEEFTVSAATEVAKGVMLGAGLNFAHARYRFNRYFDEVDIDNANDGTGISTDFESLTLNEALRSNMWGVNLRAGLSAAVVPNLKVGLTLETPTSYSVSEDFTMLLDTYFDNGDTYSDQLNVFNDYGLRTPWRFGGGLSLDLSILTLSADAEYVDWSQLQYKPEFDDDFSFDEVNRTIRRDYSGVLNAGFGGELKVGRLVRLRGGYAYHPDPRENQTLDRSKQFISAGIGLHFNRRFEIDLGWTNEQFDDQYRPYVEVENAPVVQEEVTRNRVAVGVRFNL